MLLRTSCSLEFETPDRTPFLFMLRPRSGWHQWVVREEFVMSRGVHAQEFADPFGNLCQRVIAPAGLFSVYASADVEVAPSSDTAPCAPFVSIGDLPESVLPFLYPSRFVESDRFAPIVSSIVGDALLGYDQCVRIVEHIRSTTQYTPGQGDYGISAWEVSERPSGVCRDMAHLGIAMCRALAIPARFVVGYLQDLEPMDMHAWFEAFVGGRWYTFDPTQKDHHGARVIVAYGRDAADVAIYTQFGEYVPLLRMEVHAHYAG